MHPSATNAVHDTHAAPAVPHVAGEGASQFAPAQQPDAQLADVHDVHTPDTQFCRLGHGEHVEPPVPHAPFDVPARHWPLEQQPDGHEVPSHTHAPFTHRCPGLHAGPAPQAHVPSPAQTSAVWSHVEQAPPPVPQLVSVGVSHTPLRQHPFGQDVGVHVQTPLEHT